MSTPGQDVVSPFDGTARRIIGKYQGVQVSGDTFTSRSLYVKPSDAIFGAGARGLPVQAGDVIGAALNITKTYPGITNHVHFELYLNKPWTVIDPTPFISVPIR